MVKDSTENGDFENDLSCQEELAQETESYSKGLRSPCAIILKKQWLSIDNEDFDIVTGLRK